MMPSTDSQNPNIFDLLNERHKPIHKLLINATQHKQDPEAWRSLGVAFDNPNFAPFGSISPKASVKEQIVEAWRNLLGEYTRHFDLDIPCDGVLLGGFAPVVAGLYQLCSQFRIPAYTAIMGPAPLVDGQRRGFVLAGYRRVPSPKKLRKDTPQEGQPLTAEDAELRDLMPETEVKYFTLPARHEVTRHDRYIHLSSRPLTPDRAKELATVCPQSLVSVPVVNPPPAGADCADFQDGVNEIAQAVFDNKCAVLSDGAAGETILRLYALLGHAVPFYYVQTEITPATQPGGAATHNVVGVGKIPRF